MFTYRNRINLRSPARYSNLKLDSTHCLYSPVCREIIDTNERFPAFAILSVARHNNVLVSNMMCASVFFFLSFRHRDNFLKKSAPIFTRYNTRILVTLLQI